MFKWLTLAAVVVAVVFAYNSEWAAHERECSFRPTAANVQCK